MNWFRQFVQSIMTLFSEELSNKVEISLSTTIAETAATGVIFVEPVDPSQRKVAYYFLADHPERLYRPTPETMEYLFYQIRKMGLVPISLNVLYKDNHHHEVYKAADYMVMT